MTAKTPEQTARCGLCGKPKVQVSFTVRRMRPLLHCMTCDRRPAKRRSRPSHR